MAHEAVVDAVAAVTAVLPMRFAAVVEERGVVEELLAPNEDYFFDALAGLEGRVQFALKGRFEHDVILRDLVEGDEEIRSLRQRVRELPEDASYYDRVHLGELIVGALELRREVEAEQLYERLAPTGVDMVIHQPTEPGRSDQCGVPRRPRPMSRSSRTPSRTWVASSRAGYGCGCAVRWPPTTSSPRGERRWGCWSV